MISELVLYNKPIKILLDIHASKFLSFTPFLTKLLAHVLHKNKGIKQEKGRSGTKEIEDPSNRDPKSSLEQPEERS